MVQPLKGGGKSSELLLTSQMWPKPRSMMVGPIHESTTENIVPGHLKETKAGGQAELLTSQAHDSSTLGQPQEPCEKG